MTIQAMIDDYEARIKRLSNSNGKSFDFHAMEPYTAGFVRALMLAIHDLKALDQEPTADESTKGEEG